MSGGDTSMLLSPAQVREILARGDVAARTTMATPEPEPVLQRVLVRLGLQSPLDRLVGVCAATSVLLWVTRPAFAFGRNGRPRALGSDDTYATWYTVAFAAGVVASQCL